MGKTKNKIQKIIKKSFEENMRTVGWSGMHDAPTKKIMKIMYQIIDLFQYVFSKNF